MPSGIYIRTEQTRKNMSLAHMGQTPWRKGKNYPSCLDCSIRLKDYRSIRCKSCSNKVKQLGVKLSKETKRKMSLVHKGDSRCGWAKGKHLSLEHRKAISKGQKRVVAEGRHNFWKGGIYPQNLLERVKFRQQMQKLVFERDDYTCQLCGARQDLQVDHIQSWADYVELRFSMDNCRTLCAKCHYKITFGKPMPEHIRAWGHNLGRRVI